MLPEELVPVVVLVAVVPVDRPWDDECPDKDRIGSPS